jgi:hypothetical protein
MLRQYCIWLDVPPVPWWAISISVERCNHQPMALLLAIVRSRSKLAASVHPIDRHSECYRLIDLDPSHLIVRLSGTMLLPPLVHAPHCPRTIILDESDARSLHVYVLIIHIRPDLDSQLRLLSHSLFKVYLLARLRMTVAVTAQTSIHTSNFMISLITAS